MNAADPSPAPPVGPSREAATARAAPLALWRVAEAFLGVLHTLFGAPERIAFQHTLTSKGHAQLASWLRCGEALLRRLLLIEAAAYAKPNTRPLLAPQRLRARKLIGFSADAPEAWRVCFRTLAKDRRRSAGKRRCRQDAGAPRERGAREDRWAIEERVTFRSAWPLAERFEALIRVFNDPAPYARRLSRRLHATPHRIVETLRAPPEAAHRVPRMNALKRVAEHRWRPHFASG